MVKKKGAMHFKDGHVEYILSAKILHTEESSACISIITNTSEYTCIETTKYEPPIDFGENPFEWFSPKHFKWIHEYFKKDSINDRWAIIDGPERIEFYPKKKRRLKRKLKNKFA